MACPVSMLAPGGAGRGPPVFTLVSLLCSPLGPGTWASFVGILSDQPGKGTVSDGFSPSRAAGCAFLQGTGARPIGQASSLWSYVLMTNSLSPTTLVSGLSSLNAELS